MVKGFGEASLFKTAKDNTKIAEDRLMTIGEKLKKKAKGNSPPS